MLIKVLAMPDSHSYTQLSGTPMICHTGKEAGIKSQGCGSSETTGISKQLAVEKLPPMAVAPGFPAGITTLGHSCV